MKQLIDFSRQRSRRAGSICDSLYLLHALCHVIKKFLDKAVMYAMQPRSRVNNRQGQVATDHKCIRLGSSSTLRTGVGYLE